MEIGLTEGGGGREEPENEEFIDGAGRERGAAAAGDWVEEGNAESEEERPKLGEAAGATGDGKKNTKMKAIDGQGEADWQENWTAAVAEWRKKRFDSQSRLSSCRHHHPIP